MKKIYRLEVWIFLKNAPSNSILFSSSFICAMVSNVSWRVNFVKTLVTFGIIYPTEPLLQSMTQIVCLSSVDSLSISLFYLWNEVCDPQFFFAFLTQVTNYLTAVKNLKKFIDWKMFASTSIKGCQFFFLHSLIFRFLFSSLYIFFPSLEWI